jgi:glycosyltransferase involved in cell wall biosynthesis
LYTKGQGFDGLFPDGEVGYPVNPGDPIDMVDKIQLCLSDYIPMSQRCVSNIKDFHWSNIARRYQEIYNDII